MSNPGIELRELIGLEADKYMGKAAKGSTRAARGKAAEGLVRDPIGRFESQALLCTDLAQDPTQILRWFVQRWQVEVTFREVRDHLGV